MKLHTVFVTYNRLELTKQALASYQDTVTIPCEIVIVDNGSTDGTVEWLREWACDWFVARDLHTRKQIRNAPNVWVDLLGENRYPGFACNKGWEWAPEDATHLHRADNDFKFLPGWCVEVLRSFIDNPRLGQLGLRTDDEELHNEHNVGGNCIIRRELWDAGLRWDERPWPEIKVPGYTEDSFMSPAVTQMGWEWGRVLEPCIQSLSYEDRDDPYYRKSWADRGINL